MRQLAHHRPARFFMTTYTISAAHDGCRGTPLPARRPFLRITHFCRSDAEGCEAGLPVTHPWDGSHDAEEQWHPERFLCVESVFAHLLLHGYLEELKDLCWQFTLALHRCQVLLLHVPAKRGSVSRLAAVIASWMARLFPNPPTGFIVWAASPIRSSPGRYHRCTRLVWTESRDICWFQSCKVSTRSASQGMSSAEPPAQWIQAGVFHLAVGAWLDGVSHLPGLEMVKEDGEVTWT